MDALLESDDIARLHEALTAAGYTSREIAARIGPAAVESVRRGDFRGLLRATAERDPLATLVRLFLAGQTEPADAVAAALAPLSLDAAVAARLVESYGDGLHAGVDLDVYTGHSGADWWVLSDLDADAGPGRRAGRRVRHRAAGAGRDGCPARSAPGRAWLPPPARG